MRKHNSCALSLVIFAGILLSTCGTNRPFECMDALGCVDIAPGEPIEIGVLQALSGGAAPSGIEQARGIEIAIARRGNQLLGHPIEMRVEDSLCSPEGGLNAALNVATRPQVVAILGPTCSGAAVTGAMTMAEAGLVMISASNTAPSLTGIGGERGSHWQPGYFRTRCSDAALGRFAAEFAFQELGITKVATLNDNDPYTRELANIFGRAFTELGGEVVLSAAINKGDVDMRPVLTAVAASGAELLFFPIFQPEGDFIVRQAKEVPGLETITFMTASSLLLEPFIKTIGSDGVGMYFAGPSLPENPANDELVSEFKTRYGGLPITVDYAYAYDAANLLLDAIETAAVQDANADGTLHIGRQALQNVLYAASGFEGVTGTISCDEFGDCGASGFTIMRLDDPSAGLEGLKANVVCTYSPNQ
jgi:branched-chain amino acid transport system substrate-binding protein